MTTAAAFWQFVRDRHDIYLKREAGEPPPWTDDPILSTRRFTNVVRELDRGTIWLREYEKEAGDMELVDRLFLYATYRGLNWTPTFERFGFPQRRAESVAVWHAAINQARGTKDATGRYQIQAGHPLMSAAHLPRLARHHVVWTQPGIYEVAQNVAAARDGIEVVAALRKVKGLGGPFFSAQVAADYIDGPASHLARDTVFPLAVGSRCSARLIWSGRFTRPRKKNSTRISPDPMDEVVYRDLHEERDNEAPCTMTWIDIEHSLCEWWKYENAQAGIPMSLLGNYPGNLRR